MKGKNELRMNQSTMKEAVQLWLESEFITAPKVESVVKNHELSGHGGDHFIVKLESEEEKS